MARGLWQPWPPLANLIREMTLPGPPTKPAGLFVWELLPVQMCGRRFFRGLERVDAVSGLRRGLDERIAF
jgi:hypothetical protein